MSTEVTKTWFVDGKMVEQAIPEAEIYADIHSCHYGCQRPGCISRQRDELRGYAMAIYDAVREVYPEHRMSFKEVMDFTANKMKETK